METTRLHDGQSSTPLPSSYYSELNVACRFLAANVANPDIKPIHKATLRYALDAVHRASGYFCARPGYINLFKLD